jgi:HemY protein
MKRLFIYALGALAIGAGVALLLGSDPGYVQISAHGWTLQATLASVVIGFLALCLFVIALVWLLRTFNPIKLLKPDAWRNFMARRSAEDATTEGLELLLLGRWQDAYRFLVEYADKVENPVVNYLGGAIAAHERGDKLGRNFCLDRAEKRARGDDYGIRALRAWFDTRDGETEKGLALFLALKRLVPESPFILRSIKDCYLKLTDWEGLHDLLPLLEKHKIVPAEELQSLKLRVEQHRLIQAGAESAEALRLAWQEVPKPLKAEHELIALYLKCLVQRGEDVEAGALLSRQLKQKWDDELVVLLGYGQNGNPQQLLVFLEEQLRDRPNNPVLLLTLGRVCLRNQLWGKAREYFELALRMSSSGVMTAEISAELARLLDRLGDSAQSLVNYQRVMQLLPRQLPPLPLPEKQR